MLTAVAAKRAEHVTGQALRVDAHQHVLAAIHLAHDQRQVLLAVDDAAVPDGGELPERGRESRGHTTFDQLFGAAAMLDHLCHGDHLQPVLVGVPGKIGDTRHGAVLVHDLADDAGRDEPRQARQIDRRLGMTGPFEHTTGLGAQRKHVAGLDQVVRAAGGIDRDHDRARTIRRRDAGRHAVARLDRVHECRGMPGFVAPRGQRQPELLAPLFGQGEADEATRVRRHEVDGLGRGELRGHDQVALVLTVLGVTDDHHPARADLVDRALDGGEW